MSWKETIKGTWQDTRETVIGNLLRRVFGPGESPPLTSPGWPTGTIPGWPTGTAAPYINPEAEAGTGQFEGKVPSPYLPWVIVGGLALAWFILVEKDSGP